MLITDVTTFGVSIPIQNLEDDGAAPYVTNHNEVRAWDRVVVRVDTDKGISGWSETRPFLSSIDATRSILEDGVGSAIRGRSPYELEAFRRLFFVEYTFAKPFFAPIEIACWDIVGKDLGKPLYELLGGWTAPGPTERRRDAEYEGCEEVPVAYCLGILSPARSAEHASRIAEEGYRILKTKAGRDWRQDVERVKAMHDAVDGKLQFRVDPNQGWTIDEAVRFAAALEDAGVYLQYMEQPIGTNAHRSLAQLRNRVRQPVAPNEDTYYPGNVRRIIALGAADAAVVDMTPAGGIGGLRQLAGIAEDASVPLAHHAAGFGIKHAAVLHATSAIPGLSLAPDSIYSSLAGDVLNESLIVDDGAITVPDGPGLGVTVDLDALDEYKAPENG